MEGVRQASLDDCKFWFAQIKYLASFAIESIPYLKKITRG